MKLTIAIFILSMCFYTIYYEPRNLEVKTLNFKSTKIKNDLLIAHISDLHTKGMGDIEKKLIKRIKNARPDLIVITGDIATPNGTFEGYDEVLKELKAPMGVYFVMGNWEYWAPIKNLDHLLSKNNITNLTNKKNSINLVLLTGFDDEPTGAPDLELLQTDSTIFNIALFHSPIFFEKTKKHFDLSLAGHSHGGQIRLPFIGQLWSPAGTGKYIQGMYTHHKAKLYVNRGIGNSILPIRFNCRPELTLIKLQAFPANH
jgi:predicted MPP superfamily phosphohydrolase